MEFLVAVSMVMVVSIIAIYADKLNVAKKSKKVIIIIEVDSIIQTKKEINRFAKSMVDDINKDDAFENVWIYNEKRGNNYKIKMFLPEVV